MRVVAGEWVLTVCVVMAVGCMRVARARACVCVCVCVCVWPGGSDGRRGLGCVRVTGLETDILLTPALRLRACTNKGTRRGMNKVRSQPRPIYAHDVRMSGWQCARVTLPGTHYPQPYPLCQDGILEGGPRARVWTAGPYLSIWLIPLGKY